MGFKKLPAGCANRFAIASTLVAFLFGEGVARAERKIRIKTENVDVSPTGVVLKTRKPNQSDESVQVDKNGAIILNQGQGKDAYKIKIDGNGVDIDTDSVDINLGE